MLPNKPSIYLCLVVLITARQVCAENVIWECEEPEDCASLQGGECKQGYCVCPQGVTMSEDNTKCEGKDVSPYLNSPCEQDPDCRRLVTGFHCHPDKKTCGCREGFRYYIGRCWIKSSLGDPCTSSSQCLDDIQPLSLTCRDGKCDCRDDYYARELNGDCRKKAAAVGDGCILDDDCKWIPNVEGVFCNMTSLRCQDPKDPPAQHFNVFTELNEPDEAPFPKKTKSFEGKECFTNKDCASLGAAFCSPGRTCFCSQGYFLSEDGTACHAELGTRNPVDGSCKLFSSEVVDGVCQCPVGYFYSDLFRVCRKPARRLGDSCLNDLSCRTFGLNSFCDVDYANFNITKCVCDPLMSETNLERQLCEPPISFVGEDCENDSNCPSTSTCVAGKCTCPEGTMPNPSNIICVETNLEFGASCVMSEQCTRGDYLVCVNGVCNCDQGYVVDEETPNVCVPGIGSVCSHDTDCKELPNTECKNVTTPTKRCECVQNFVQWDNTCYRAAANIDDECENNAQCEHQLGNSTTISCDRGRCRCQLGYHFRDRQCIGRKALGEVCTSSSQCYIKGDVYNSECRNSLCQCKPGLRATFQPDACDACGGLGSSMWLLATCLLAAGYFIR